VAQQLDLFGSPDGADAGGGDCAGAGPSVLEVRGPLAAETALLAIVDELTAAARREPALLAAPVRVVVPSRSLRRHVAARLVRPRAVAGVAVQTLHGLACEVLEHAGVAVPRGHLLFETLVEREARQEPVLRRGLGDLVDGYLAVAPAVADLLDAGFEPEHADAVDEALATDGPRAAGRAEVERARALVRVAARTELRLRRLGLGRRSTLLRLAAEALAAGPPERVLPARAVLLHGFISARGVAADLLLALLRWRGATLLIDRPADPGSGVDLEAAVTRRLVERAAGVVGSLQAPPAVGRAPAPVPADVASPAVPTVRAPVPADVASPALPTVPPPAFSAFPALGAEAEAREVARRLRRLLDGSPDRRPEDLAVVARDFAPYRLALRRHLRRLGVPFSGVGERGALLPAGRRAAAVLDLLRWGTEAPADRWLDASALLNPGLRVDLRLALGALGAARLRQVAALRDQELGGGLALPVREGLALAAAGRPGTAEAPPPDDDAEGRAVARARRISGRRLREGVLLAARVHDRLQAWPRRTAAGAQLAWLRGLLADLGLADDEEAGPLAAAVSELDREVPGELELGSEELRLLLARALGDGGSCPLGGDGGGVQVLSVAEARGRTFDHLFLIGLNRDVFPRPAPEDPLLPDDLRQVLRPLLPDLPLARDGFEDERQAFAQLLAAAPDVCLSWRAADDDGKPLAASPLVERLMHLVEPLRAPALFSSVDMPAETDVRPADELAVLAGLRGSRQELGRVLPIALRQVREELGRPLLELDVEALAAARLRVLDELDPDPRTAAGRAAAARLGPYFGFAGAHPLGSRYPLYVTHLEALVACPWQLFLGRLLRVERPPDPLRALPGDDPLRLGILVHRALDRLVQRALAGGAGEEQDAAAAATAAGVPERPAAAVPERPAAVPTPDRVPVPDRAATPDRVPVLVPWPAAADVEALLGEVAVEVLAEEGLALPGLARALARHALPYVEAARELDWPAGGAALPVVASEVEGELSLGAGGGRARRLRFRADRQDLVGGWLRFTDYKTGKPLAAGGDAVQRRRRLLADVRAGRRLQAVAYVLAAGGGKAIGRYLFLRPDLDAAAREAVVEASDAEARAAFAAAAGTALAAWDAGSFFPRLGPTVRRDPPRCTFCTVAEACLRGDPAAHRRLHGWAARAGARAASPAGPAEAALLALWDLPAAAGEAAAPEAAAAELDPEGGGG
jgi:hypothetical protein